MEFPKVDFSDENACFETLLKLVHTDGLHCPRCGLSDRMVIHDHHGPSWIADYLCKRCPCVFNAWTGSIFEKTHHPPSRILQIIQGRLEGKSKAQLARELECHRGRLSAQIDSWQGWITAKFGPPPHKQHRIHETKRSKRTVHRKPQKSARKSYRKTATW